jgi:hypothetical protein
MNIKISADDARWTIREAADEARWGAREAAWSFEERVVWRGGDSARKALRAAHRAVSPLERLVQTKLAWPLADRLDDYGHGVRTGIATLGIAAAVAAGVAGASISGSGGEASNPVGTPAAIAAISSAPATTLEGVTPDFASDPDGSAVKGARGTAPAPPPVVEPDTPPDAVSLAFAQAFVQYEVGRGDKKTAEALAASSTPPLAKALGTDPPRLPSGTKVPQARVLNVVLGKQHGDEMTASVSLVRLEAASELRLTLTHSKKNGWRVAEVLG